MCPEADDPGRRGHLGTGVASGVPHASELVGLRSAQARVTAMSASLVEMVELAGTGSRHRWRRGGARVVGGRHRSENAETLWNKTSACAFAPEGNVQLDWGGRLGHRLVVLELVRHGAVVEPERGALLGGVRLAVAGHRPLHRVRDRSAHLVAQGRSGRVL